MTADVLRDQWRNALFAAGWREKDGRWIAPAALHSIDCIREQINGSRRLGLHDAMAINKLAELSRGKRAS